MLAGKYGGRDVDLITVFESVGKAKAGEMSKEEVEALADVACPGCGSCSGLFTANSMNCLTEAIGLALPGNGTIPAVEAARVRLAKRAGKLALELISKKIKPSDLVKDSSLKNALAVDMAIGGSSNTMLHLPAIVSDGALSPGLFLWRHFS